MRILLTGATGFLGKHVLPRLAGHQVLCLSREPGAVLRQSGVTVQAADLGEDGAWVAAVTDFKPEWCIHLAWEGLPDYGLDRCRANLDASLRLLGVIVRCGVRRVVTAGSCWEYGRASGALVEATSPIDVGLFAATKHALLAMLDSAARQSGMEYRWARVFFVYGPGQRPTSLIPSTRTACLAGRPPDIREPGAVQDFVHVEDVAAGLVALSTVDHVSGAFNLGSGTPTSVAHVANQVAEHYGRPHPVERVPSASGFWADTTKMQAVTGWRTRIAIDDGIKQTLSAMDAGA